MVVSTIHSELYLRLYLYSLSVPSLNDSLYLAGDWAGLFYMIDQEP